MSSVKEFRCEICGTVSEDPIHWFVIECTDQKLAVIKWDLTAATSQTARYGFIRDNDLSLGGNNDQSVYHYWCGVHAIVFIAVCAFAPDGLSSIGVEAVQKTLTVADVRAALIYHREELNSFSIGSVWAEFANRFRSWK